ncbi:unnamed protein product [Nippostrongylus brasiliensis]|uniref:PhoU domain-containing protein n=1 Tax=Nippostrongylus brasiliensis TaxID=27835 RepID=A0A0N4YEP1_NIPBR|nr:unnamed protein product [Nippostrongylus brasiliensis]
MLNIEERTALTEEMLARIYRMLLNFDQRLSRIERTVNAIDQKLSAPQGPLEFRYCSAAKIADLTIRMAHENSVNFARALELEIFKDSDAQLGEKVSDRHSIDRVNLLKECRHRFYYVPIALRDEFWKKIKASLITRLRKVRKDLKDKAPLLAIEDGPGTSGTFNDAFDFTSNL